MADLENFSDYIVYLDESGSPVLNADMADFPVFVLACILIKKKTYATKIVPAIQDLKFKYVGHDQIILHENGIRRQGGKFTFLRTDKQIRLNFLNDLSNLIKISDFEILACVIDKNAIPKKDFESFDPYKIALLFSMKILALRLEELKQGRKVIHVIAESRGKKEDKELELEFRRIADDKTFLPITQPDLFKNFDWRILFSDKRVNSAGLQLADLVARPIGIHALHPKKQNRAFEIIKKKKPLIAHYP